MIKASAREETHTNGNGPTVTKRNSTMKRKPMDMKKVDRVYHFTVWNLLLNRPKMMGKEGTITKTKKIILPIINELNACWMTGDASSTKNGEIT